METEQFGVDWKMHWRNLPNHPLSVVVDIVVAAVAAVADIGVAVAVVVAADIDVEISYQNVTEPKIDYLGLVDLY